MAAPVNLSGLEALFSSNSEPMYVGKSKEWWYKHGRVMTEQSAFVADSDCRGLVARVLELQREDYWRQFSDDWGEFCMEAFGRPAAWIEQVVEGVRLLHLQEPERLEKKVPAAEAIELKRHGGDRRSEVFQLQQHGGNRRHDQVDNINLKGGTQASYLKARLQRDHPQLADALDRGEFKSARAAAIEAGIIKPVPTVRLVSDINVIAAKLCQHLTPEQCHALAEALLQ